MKLTTKLLLGATVIAGLSISAFAACATDVYMGNKQLKDVAGPTLTTDAATKGYVDGQWINLTLENNVTNVGSAVLRANRVGDTIVVSGRILVQASLLTNGYRVATFSDTSIIPTVTRPILGMCYNGSEVRPVWFEYRSTGVVEGFGWPTNGCTDIGITGVIQAN